MNQALLQLKANIEKSIGRGENVEVKKVKEEKKEYKKNLDKADKEIISAIGDALKKKRERKITDFVGTGSNQAKV